MADDRADCPHCGNGAEVYRYMARKYVFDVDRARELVSDGREPVELEREDVEFSVQNCRIYPQHVAHVDTRYPGIIAHIWYPEANGEWVHGHVLIDGNHRAARCLQLDLPYYVHVLTEEESREILIKGPRPERCESVCGTSACREAVCCR